MKDIVRQWGRMISSRFRKEAAKSVIGSPVAYTGEAGALNARESDVCVATRLPTYFSVDQARHEVLLAADDDELIAVDHRCMMCNFPYRVNVKAWKIRSCNYIAAPCPKCHTFQTLDMAEVRKMNFRVVTQPVPSPQAEARVVAQFN